MAGRKRRSADEARAELLRVAEDRLARYGLDGLNIVDVAGEAGVTVSLGILRDDQMMNISVTTADRSSFMKQPSSH